MKTRLAIFVIGSLLHAPAVLAQSGQGVMNESNAVIREQYSSCDCAASTKTFSGILCYFDYCAAGSTFVKFSQSQGTGAHICNLTSINNSLYVQYTEYGPLGGACINGTLLVAQLAASQYNWTSDDLHYISPANVENDLQAVYNATYPFGRCFAQNPNCGAPFYRLIDPGRYPVTPAAAIITGGGASNGARALRGALAVWGGGMLALAAVFV